MPFMFFMVCFHPVASPCERLRVRRFFAWTDREPAGVTRVHVGRFLMHLREQGRSVATLSLHLSALRTAFDRVLNERVTAGYYLARPTRPRRTGLQPTQCEALLRAAASRRDALILFCLLVLKLKPAAIRHLRVADVDTKQGAIRTWRGYGRAEENKTVPAARLGRPYPPLSGTNPLVLFLALPQLLYSKQPLTTPESGWPSRRQAIGDGGALE